MKFISTLIPGAFLIELSPIIDPRGAFTRLYCQRELSTIKVKKDIVQINHSLNPIKGTIRGMHFQNPPSAEIKIIRCIRGSVFDVLIDLRKGSPTFLQHFSVELTPSNYHSICIPEGCAHGFQTLEENSELLYFHTEFWDKKSEGGVRFDDPLINIKWPLPAEQLTDKDKSYPLLNPEFDGILPFDFTNFISL